MEVEVLEGCSVFLADQDGELFAGWHEVNPEIYPQINTLVQQIDSLAKELASW